MKTLSVLLSALICNSSFASQCFDLSKDGKTWDSKPFSLCIDVNTGGTSEYKLTLSKDKKNIAIYFLNFLPGGADARTFGVNSETGSIVDDSITISVGYGEIMIGTGKYFYRE
jgi:hypothetical protein